MLDVCSEVKLVVPCINAVARAHEREWRGAPLVLHMVAYM